MVDTDQRFRLINCGLLVLLLSGRLILILHRLLNLIDDLLNDGSISLTIWHHILNHGLNLFLRLWAVKIDVDLLAHFLIIVLFILLSPVSQGVLISSLSYSSWTPRMTVISSPSRHLFISFVLMSIRIFIRALRVFIPRFFLILFLVFC